ncbi:MAG: hypothetical protein CDV28_101172 [Candidatus Electronema aureum]|uniref:Uncharacterized protein n=1 Tax=Candidatus Electronema aureum TaxID=2005002 RepID=A0A521G5I1_9BACT|nr:MAG: hypothetical protein CDV28_101172 [Candidatus Electronema aureum]
MLTKNQYKTQHFSCMIPKVNSKGRVRLHYPCFLHMLRQFFSNIYQSQAISHHIAESDLFFKNIFCPFRNMFIFFCLYNSEFKLQISL